MHLPKELTVISTAVASFKMLLQEIDDVAEDKLESPMPQAAATLRKANQSIRTQRRYWKWRILNAK